MGREASPFETSEMLANFLASTPLLSQSWKVCNLANTNYPHGFITQQIGTTGYVAFSGVQSISGPDTCGGNQMVPLDGTCNGFFSSICKQNIEEEDDDCVLVHGGFLQIFLSIHATSDLQHQIMAMKDKCKSIVITGHSIGGTTASLCALWLLSYLQSISSSCSVLCLTFGSAFLGNESLSRSILRERWGGNFCHVVSKYDIMPRLLFGHLPYLNQKLHALLQFWHCSMMSSSLPAVGLDHASIAEIFGFVLSSLEKKVQTNGDVKVAGFSPFANFLFCSEEGAICLDNSASIIRMMHLLFASGSPSYSVEDHLKYGHYVDRVSSQFLMKRDFNEVGIPETSFEAGVTLTLQSSGIALQEPIRRSAQDCINLSRRMGRSPSLNSADLAIQLSKIAPYRAEIEWYKATCDQSDDQMGYYDSFKQRGASKRDLKVNMNRYKLARFWDNVIHMMETNRLPYDFHKQDKWVNASQFYMLLVEPLDIAEYYRRNMHREKGHYRYHARERRYQIFDSWWKQRKHRVENTNRSKFASQTQDTCFWARVEEARDALDNVQRETDQRSLAQLWQELHDFDRYASGLIERKEVSEDVLAKNSSYSLWVRDYRELRSQVEQLPSRFPVVIDGLEEMVP